MSNSILQYLVDKRIFLGKNARKPLFCRDGFSMSVQAGEGYFSFPRKNDFDRYTHFEVSYTSELESLLTLFRQGKEFDEDGNYSGVFSYVPLELIEKIIEKHGGLLLEPFESATF